jgi:hypothetical protein
MGIHAYCLVLAKQTSTIGPAKCVTIEDIISICYSDCSIHFVTPTMSSENVSVPLSVQKYRTLARAVIAQDEPACRELYQVLQDQGKDLTDDEVMALGLRWLSSGQKKDQPPRSIEVAKFLGELGFDFTMTIRLSKDEVVGSPIPHRLAQDEVDHAILLELIDNGLVPLTVQDGLGDNLLVECMTYGSFDLAEKLITRGIGLDDINLAQQTALHVMAGRVLFEGVDWLLKHKADPTVEDIGGNRPSELVPEDLDEWDVSSMYETLEDACIARSNNTPYQPTPEFSKMVKKEAGRTEPEQTLGEMTDDLSSMASSLLGKMGP